MDVGNVSKRKWVAGNGSGRPRDARGRLVTGRMPGTMIEPHHPFMTQLPGSFPRITCGNS